MPSSSVTYKSSAPPDHPFSLNTVQSRLSTVYVTLFLEGVRNMAEANDMSNTSARSALPISPISGADAEDVVECAGSWPRHDEESGDTEQLRYVACT